MELPITLEILDITTEIRIPNFNQTVGVEWLNLRIGGPCSSEAMMRVLTNRLVCSPSLLPPWAVLQLTWRIGRSNTGILLTGFGFFGVFLVYTSATLGWLAVLELAEQTLQARMVTGTLTDALVLVFPQLFTTSCPLGILKGFYN